MNDLVFENQERWWEEGGEEGERFGGSDKLTRLKR